MQSKLQTLDKAKIWLQGMCQDFILAALDVAKILVTEDGVKILATLHVAKILTTNSEY